MLRLNEHYVSVQGEGPNTGKLTQFVRFAGCNMRCPGWPCDTIHAVDPALWKNDPKLSAEEIANAIMGKKVNEGASHICITGGEPFMQDASHLKTLIQLLGNRGCTVDIFTNGSFAFPTWTSLSFINIVMDWKLPGSGEATTKLDVREKNLQLLTFKDAVKFVINTEDDLAHVYGLVTGNLFDKIKCNVWIGRAWNSTLSNDDLIDFLKHNGFQWNLNVQMHKYLWPNVERGI
jgi:7-carboxy-7-deazaguanine synthase